MFFFFPDYNSIIERSKNIEKYKKEKLSELSEIPPI